MPVTYFPFDSISCYRTAHTMSITETSTSDEPLVYGKVVFTQCSERLYQSKSQVSNSLVFEKFLAAENTWSNLVIDGECYLEKDEFAIKALIIIIM